MRTAQRCGPRGQFGRPAIEGLPDNPEEGKLIVWAVNNDANLPEPRTDASGWSANGAIYLIGGTDGTTAKSQLYWAIPTTTGRSRNGSTSTSANCRRPASQALPRYPRARRDPGRRHDGHRRAGLQRPREYGSAITVLLARHPRGDDPGAQAGRGDRPAARLPGRRRRRHGQLHPAIAVGVAFAHKERTMELLHRLRRRGKA